MVNGTVQTTKTNTYGFTSYKVNGTWYGADAKGGPRAGEGDQVQFEAYNKAGKDGREWPTIKLSSLTKVAAQTAPVAVAQGAAPSKAFVPAVNAGSRDTYWADKAKTDEAKDPRIAYFAASERAIQFVDLALRNGAFIKDSEFAKLKQTQKLEVLTAFVDAQTDRIMAASYAATVPTAPTVKGTADTETAETEAGEAEEWS